MGIVDEEYRMQALHYVRTRIPTYICTHVPELVSQCGSVVTSAAGGPPGGPLIIAQQSLW